MYVQSILINKNKLNKKESLEYVKKMGFAPIKFREGKYFYRYRIYRPDVFKKFRTKRINDILTIIFADFE